MFNFDITTILGLTALNLFAVSAALPLIMGSPVSRSARLSQLTILCQASAWASLLASEFVLDKPLSVLAMALGSVANFCLFEALGGWLGQRPYRRLMALACLLMPLGYALSFDNYPIRVGWANAWLALQFGLVARAALWPEHHWGYRWRYLLAGCFSTVGLLTLGRGVLGAFFTEAYPSFTTPHPVNIVAQLAVNLSTPLTVVAVLVAWRRESESRLKGLANTDGLTTLPNRRGWSQQGVAMVAQARRQGWPLAVLMLDLDYFKRINDAHGHEVGDRALAFFGQAIRANLRDNDLAGRLGGEEFALLLPHTDEAGARLLDQRLRDHVRSHCAAALGLELNYSTGFSLCQPNEPEALDTALARADRALYAAKAAGRGRFSGSA